MSRRVLGTHIHNRKRSNYRNDENGSHAFQKIIAAVFFQKAAFVPSGLDIFGLVRVSVRKPDRLFHPTRM
jgi:hypothetical protein